MRLFLLSITLSLCFPLHPFVVEVLNNHGGCLGKLVTHSHSILLSFFLRCENVGVRPTLDLFHYIFQASSSSAPKSKGFISLSARLGMKIFKDSMSREWKSKFAFLFTSLVLPFDIPWGTHFCKYSPPQGTPTLTASAKKFTKNRGDSSRGHDDLTKVARLRCHCPPRSRLGSWRPLRVM